MGKKKIYTDWEYDQENESIRIFKDGGEVDMVDLAFLVEEYLIQAGFELE